MPAGRALEADLVHIFSNKALDQRRVGRQLLDTLGQRLDAVKLDGTLGRLAKRLHNRFGKLDGQGGFQNDHRHAGVQLLARHFHAIGGVGVDDGAKALEGVLDGCQPVGVRAFAAGKTVACGSIGKSGISAEIKAALAG